jgi:hypothetical protein
MIAFLLPNGVPHFTVLRARRNALKIVLVDRRPGLRGGKGGKIFKGGRCSKGVCGRDMRIYSCRIIQQMGALGVIAAAEISSAATEPDIPFKSI